MPQVVAFDPTCLGSRDAHGGIVAGLRSGSGPLEMAVAHSSQLIAGLAAGAVTLGAGSDPLILTCAEATPSGVGEHLTDTCVDPFQRCDDCLLRAGAAYLLG
jgi:hypothetical protein